MKLVQDILLHRCFKERISGTEVWVVQCEPDDPFEVIIDFKSLGQYPSAIAAQNAADMTEKAKEILANAL